MNKNALITKSLINRHTNIYEVNQSKKYKSYFITYKFQIPWNHRQTIFKSPYANKITQVWTEHNEAYTHLMAALEKRYNEKPHKMPQELAFIDYPDTRNNIFSGYKTNGVPHIHCVMMLHPSHIEKFEKLRSESFSRIVNHRRLPCLQDIHAETIGESLENFHRAAGYAAKFFTSYPASFDSELEDVELWRINPKPIKDIKAYQRSINSGKVWEPS